MKRFIFRLENVLNLRKRREEGIELEFSKRKAELLKIEAEIMNLKAKLSRFLKDNRYSEGIFTIFEILAVDNYIVRIEQEIHGLENHRNEKEIEVKRLLNLLIEAKKAKKIIENLKEKQLSRYNEEIDREENIELDDINQNISLNKEVLTIEDAPMEDM